MPIYCSAADHPAIVAAAHVIHAGRKTIAASRETNDEQTAIAAARNVISAVHALASDQVSVQVTGNRVSITLLDLAERADLPAQLPGKRLRVRGLGLHESVLAEVRSGSARAATAENHARFLQQGPGALDSRTFILRQEFPTPSQNRDFGAVLSDAKFGDKTDLHIARSVPPYQVHIFSELSNAESPSVRSISEGAAVCWPTEHTVSQDAVYTRMTRRRVESTDTLLSVVGAAHELHGISPSPEPESRFPLGSKRPRQSSTQFSDFHDSETPHGASGASNDPFGFDDHGSTSPALAQWSDLPGLDDHLDLESLL